MLIEPDTTLVLLRNCPLDPTYDHTLYFDSKTAQEAYFRSLAARTLEKLSYQRATKGKLRVAVQMNYLMDVNYMMFKNSAFENKWFYAFVKNVEYVNNITSEIEYELDVMQTWAFDYELGECFVEREHTATDEIGENTVPENVETGPYITMAQSNFTVDNLRLIMYVTERLDGLEAFQSPTVIGGFPVACYVGDLGVVNSASLSVLRNIIDDYTYHGKANAIVAIFTVPNNMVGLGGTVRTVTFEGAVRTLPYIPHNKKLYTYPYCCLSVTALGQGMELRYELFEKNVRPTFNARGGFGPNMEVIATPQMYAGKADNLEYCVTLKGFPLCAWISDYFQNWLAQNKATLIASTTTGAVSGIVNLGQSILTGNVTSVAGQLTSIFSNVANKVASVYQQSIVPDQMTGAASSPDIQAVSGLMGFYTSCKTITEEYLKIIDGYFDMYGYKVNALKVPNRNVRPHWTYTKTAGCVVHGGVPADAIKKITDIYNNGITFWKNGAEVGNYSLPNEPS